VNVAADDAMFSDTRAPEGGVHRRRRRGGLIARPPAGRSSSTRSGTVRDAAWLLRLDERKYHPCPTPQESDALVCATHRSRGAPIAGFRRTCITGSPGTRSTCRRSGSGRRDPLR
jgi:hypothetical protein